MATKRRSTEPWWWSSRSNLDESQHPHPSKDSIRPHQQHDFQPDVQERCSHTQKTTQETEQEPAATAPGILQDSSKVSPRSPCMCHLPSAGPEPSSEHRGASRTRESRETYFRHQILRTILPWMPGCASQQPKMGQGSWPSRIRRRLEHLTKIKT